MASMYQEAAPPIRGQTWSFSIALRSVLGVGYIFQTTTTLAAGDIQVSKDGANFANLATFPPVERKNSGAADSGVLLVELTAAEMTADEVAVLFHDQAGAEWLDELVVIRTVAPVEPDVFVTGIDNDVIDENTLDATAVAEIQAGLAVPGDEMNLADDAITSGKYDESTAFPVKADDSGNTLIARRGTTAGVTLSTLAGYLESEILGAVSQTITVNDENGFPIYDAVVFVSTDEGGGTIVTSGQTDTAGQVTLWCDPGTYYVWVRHPRYRMRGPVEMEWT